MSLVQPTPVEGQETAAAASKLLPIGLDTVLRLAEGQNSQVAIAREKLREACAGQDLAHLAWLPTFQVGPSYFRHEGGLQNPDGTLERTSSGALFAGLSFYSRLDLREAVFQQVSARRQVWQEKGELSRITSEALLEAATTYIDLLAVRHRRDVVQEIAPLRGGYSGTRRKIAKPEPGTQVQVEAIEAEVFGLRQVVARLNQQGDAASRKLVYLLGLPPEVQLVPVDGQLMAFELVDPSRPTEELVQQALAHGPGVREMERLLMVVLAGHEKARGCGRLAPVLEVGMLEGAFGCGPGSRSDWDNRLDVGVQARWNLTDLITGPQMERVIAARMQQAQLTYHDLRAKLTLGVEEARAASLSGRNEVHLVDEAVHHADEGFKLSRKRLQENIPGSTTTEVLQYIRGLQIAYAGYINAVSSYDKAQLRLMVLTGCGDQLAPQSIKQPAEGQEKPAP